MRIAQVAPLYEAVPPKLYGGTERIVAHLTDALVDLGHDVTLFASAEAETKAALVPCRDQAMRLDPALRSDLAAHIVMLEEVRRRADAFDIVHFHIDLLQMPLFRDLSAHTVTTLHGRLDIKDLPPFYARFPDFPVVSISDDQRRPLRGVSWAGTVHHGLPKSLYACTPVPEGDYLAFLGRLALEKRPDHAIEIAKRAGVKLKIAAKVDAADRTYFEQQIEPLLDHPLIEFIGEISDAEKAAFLGNARAVLFPIDWPEPFGLVMIEAMACGTPVIAFRRGSVPEVLEDGRTGFVVEDVASAVDAVYRLDRLDRAAIRARFEERFTAQRMASDYVAIYRSLLRTAKSLDQRLLPWLDLEAGQARAAGAAELGAATAA
jgi:glycosyltransferase involved in cell wall biosynthesis